jgi:hypothetical protein
MRLSLLLLFVTPFTLRPRREVLANLSELHPKSCVMASIVDENDQQQAVSSSSSSLAPPPAAVTATTSAAAAAPNAKEPLEQQQQQEEIQPAGIETSSSSSVQPGENISKRAAKRKLK